MLQDKNIVEAASKLNPQWLAGFFDGEGCVSIYVRKNNRHGLWPVLKVTISQVDAKLLALIALKYKGLGPYSSKHKNKQHFSVQWDGGRAKYILEVIKDHVVLKREQVLYALEFCTLWDVQNGRDAIPQENLKRRLELARSVSALNQEHTGLITNLPSIEKIEGGLTQ